MATILAGLNLLVTNGQILFRGVPASLTNIGKSTLMGNPTTVWIALLLAVAAWYLIELTPFGRYLRATVPGERPRD